MKKRVLIACEESQAVCTEMRRLGHEAYSCDILPCSGGYPEWHIQGDCLPLIDGDCEFRTMDGELHRIDGEWDLLLAFPPCTHLATSGARHFAKKREDGKQSEAIEFFCKFLNAKCQKIAIENPMGIMSGGHYLETYFPQLAEKYAIPRKWTQKIQPWWFAENEDDQENYHEKTTCLWLIGLSPLDVPVTNLRAPKRFTTSTGVSFPAWYSKTSLRGRGPRQMVRSKTFPGTAKAMAEQWAGKANEMEEEKDEKSTDELRGLLS